MSTLCLGAQLSSSLCFASVLLIRSINISALGQITHHGTVAQQAVIIGTNITKKSVSLKQIEIVTVYLLHLFSLNTPPHM